MSTSLAYLSLVVSQYVEWRPIPGFPGYEASSRGDVRSAKCIMSKREIKTGGKRGYIYVTVKRNGISKSMGIQRLICLGFHGEPPTPKHETAHNNGVRGDNWPSNLRWATAAENTADKFIHGTVLMGEKSPQAILTECDVRDILRLALSQPRLPCGRLYARGVIKKIAETYGVRKATIGLILDGTGWKHIDREEIRLAWLSQRDLPRPSFQSNIRSIPLFHEQRLIVWAKREFSKDIEGEFPTPCGDAR